MLRPNPADWLAYHAQVRPTAPALLAPAESLRWSYAEFHQRVERLAAGLCAAGVVTGDRLAVLAENRSDTLTLLFACARLGAMLMPLNWRLTVPELQFQLDDARPRYLFHDATHAALAAPLSGVQAVALTELDRWLSQARLPATDINPETPLLLLYTSGTTGQPKGALLSQRMLAANADNTALSWDLSAADRSTAHAPFFHTGGLNVLTLPLLQRGGLVVVLPRFDPAAVLAAVGQWQLTVLFAVPTMFQLLADHPNFAGADLRSLRFCMSGGAPCPLPLMARWAERGLTFKQGYGLTEAGVNCLTLPEDYAVSHRGSVGFPNWGTQARIVDEQGQEVGPEQVGELWLAGPTLCSGYWQRPDASAALFVGPWLQTGDLFRRDADGFYYVVDRKKDLYISGGENVYPAEVEAAIQRQPGVVAAAVIGIPDPRWGEVGCAFVQMAAGQTLDATALQAALGQCLARFKCPRELRQLDALPLNSSGKVQKAELRRRWAAGE